MLQDFYFLLDGLGTDSFQDSNRDEIQTMGQTNTV
jgi:hypothetical protein